MSECLKHISKVNATFAYRSDEELYGHRELWNNGLNGNGYGDCEDYLLEIRKHCGGDMYFCRYNGVGHAVLQLPNSKWIDTVHRQPVDNLGTMYTDFSKLTIWYKLVTGWVKKKLFS